MGKTTIRASRLLLVSKKAVIRGEAKVASSSNGIVDIAAAAELGLIENKGLVAAIPERVRAKARKLLLKNELREITSKKSTIRGDHKKASDRSSAYNAISKVIGPMYWHEMEKKTKSKRSQAMSRKRVVDWIRAEIENDASLLNKQLTRCGYAEISGLKRSTRWWLNLL